MARTKGIFVKDHHDEAGEVWWGEGGCGSYSGDKGTTMDGECEIMLG